MQDYGDLEGAFCRSNGYEIDAWIQRELDALQVDTSQRQRPFASLSGGEQTRALLAALFVQPDSYPLVDEPTNHLDLAGREQVVEYLEGKSGFLLVSHDRHFLDRAVDRALLKNHEKTRVLKLKASPRGPYTGTQPLLTATNLSLSRSGRTLIEALSFVVTTGTRLAVIGGNGTGKTSLLDVLCGDLNDHRGIVKTRGPLHISRSYQNPLWTRGTLDSHLDRTGLDHVRFRTAQRRTAQEDRSGPLVRAARGLVGLG